MAQVQKPSIPKGTRDFGPVEMAGRNYIFDVVKSVFKKFGYKPIETPSMENLSTLLGKYGDEGDKLLFKILNSGDAFGGVQPEQLGNSNALSLKVCEKGLRYDLTVPFARFVVQHRNDLAFPFKRYQIQPVWRADRPQKGRYREFYQCDVDVVGSRSLLNELELVQIADEVFNKFGINVCIKINNRKILAGLAEVMGFPDKITEITVAMDKLDKIGLDAVKAEMIQLRPYLLQHHINSRHVLSPKRTEKMACSHAQMSMGSPILNYMTNVLHPMRTAPVTDLRTEIISVQFRYQIHKLRAQQT
ncbi:MAG: histidine--tRNA ligase, partial [Candidatus Egerieousia sp.]